MIAKVFKYFLFFLLTTIIIGGCGWFLARWFMINDPIPEGALKVLAKIIS